MKLCFSIILLIFSNYSLGNSAFFKEHERGWFWYEDPKDKIVEKKKESKETVTIQKNELSPREFLKKQGENWENSLAKAVLSPSKQNVLNYIGQTAKINDQAQKFSQAFKEAIWVNPQYDYSLEGPHNTQAILAQNEQQNTLNEKDIKNIADHNGLVFLFDPNCPVCHRFAPLLKQFEEHYQFEVIAVSSNGKGIPDYPTPQENMDFGKRVNNKIYPSLFLVNPDSGKITPISYGYADWSSLIKKTIAAHRRINE